MDKTISNPPFKNDNQPQERLSSEKIQLLDAIYVASHAAVFNNNDKDANPFNSEVLAKSVVNFPHYNRALIMYKSAGVSLDAEDNEVISPYAKTSFKIVKLSEIGLDHIKISNFADNFTAPVMKEVGNENVLFEANTGFQIARQKDADPEMILEYIKFEPKNLDFKPMSKADAAPFKDIDALELIHGILEDSEILDMNDMFNRLYQDIIDKNELFDIETEKIAASNSVLDLDAEYKKVSSMPPFMFTWNYRKNLKEIVVAKEVLELKEIIEDVSKSAIILDKNNTPKLNARQLKAYYILKLTKEREEQLAKAKNAHTNPHQFNAYMNDLDQELELMEKALELLESTYDLKLDVEFIMEKSDEKELER